MKIDKELLERLPIVRLTDIILMQGKQGEILLKYVNMIPDHILLTDTKPDLSKYLAEIKVPYTNNSGDIAIKLKFVQLPLPTQLNMVHIGE
jgi:hypothetical protein